jgi:hypothetical protein
MAKDDEELATVIVDAAIKVHRALGPGLLESAYQQRNFVSCAPLRFNICFEWR